MKLKYYIAGVAMTLSASFLFTACDDDDIIDEPVVVVTPESGNSDLSLTEKSVRVKIGADNRVALPAGGSDVKAFSLDPSVANVVEEGGKILIEGFKNGTTDIMVSDAGNNYKTLPVTVYTTENMQLSHSAMDLEAILGTSALSEDVKVTLGNGGYSAKSDNDAVQVYADEETGVVTVNARAKKDVYTAVVTVSDASGLEANFTVKVIPTFDPFTPAQIEDILSKKESLVWADCKDPSDGNEPYYFGYRLWGYGEFLNGDSDNTKTIGWWLYLDGDDYGGLKLEYPSSTAVGTSTEGKMYFRYSYYEWYGLYEYPVEVTLLEDNDERIVAIASQADLANERLNRGYFIVYK